jgi:two-component system sensor histidine kinase HydH
MRIRYPGTVPLLILLAIVLLLSTLLTVLGQRGLKREGALLMEGKRHQARLLLATLSTAVRFDMITPDPERRYLKNSLYDASSAEGVSFIALYDGEFRLLISSPGFDLSLHGLSPADVRDLLGGRSSAEFTSKSLAGEVLVTVSRIDPLGAPWLRLRQLEVPPVIDARGEDGARGVRMTRVAAVGITISDLAATAAESRRQILLNGFLLLLLGTIGMYFLILVLNRHIAHKVLADAKQYAVDVVEGMEDGLISIDHDGVIRTLNRGAERVLGIPADEALGLSWMKVFAGDRWKGLSALIGAGRPCYGRPLPPLGPQLAPLVVSLAAVKGQAGRGGMVVFLRDREEVENLRVEVRRSERLAALGRLVAGMAHEIRNPLNSIRGFTQLLSGRFALGSQESRAVEIVIREVDRLNRVITELLDFSRPREMILAPLDLDQVAQGMVALVEREAAGGGVKLVVDAERSGVRVEGDADALKQMLLNLLLNALQAMPEGGVLTLSTRREEGDVVLSVADTGPGVPPDDAERIFEPFFTTRSRGTGLGLAIVHRIVKDHGGEIRVKSNPGRGSVFEVRLPAMAMEKEGKGGTL